MTLFEFFNQQHGWRLLGFSVLFLLSIWAVTEMISNIFKYTFGCKKQKKKDEKTKCKSDI
jgi:hypothetical protein